MKRIVKKIAKNKKKQSKYAHVFNISNEAFKMTVACVIGSREQISNTFHRSLREEDWEEIDDFVYNINIAAECRSLLNADNERGYVIWICEKDLSVGAVTHELLHYLCRSLELKGIKFNKDTEEIYTYLLGYYIDEFFKQYNKKVLKCQSTKHLN